MKPKEWDKIAKTYHENLKSPFGKVLNNPLQKAIKDIKNKDKKSVIDIGCGIGNLLPYLKGFKHITATDFSKEMLIIAKNKYPKIEFFEADSRNLKQFKNYDIAFAINSIIMPSIKDVDITLKQVKNTLKKQGILIAVFPAIESLLNQSMLVYERQFEKTKNESKAKIRTKKIIGNHNFMFSIINDNGKQKHFYKFELKHR